MILDLQAVKSYIDERIKETPDNEAGKLTAGTLDIIQSLIELYQESYDPAHLYEALRLVECIQIQRGLGSSVSSFFSNNADMRQFLILHKFPVLTRPHQSDEVRKDHHIQHALPGLAEPILGAIYKKISGDLQKNQIVWSHSLPLNENNEVMNSEIHNWQQYMTSPPENPILAHCDFKRNTRLGNNDPASFHSDNNADAETDTRIKNEIARFVAPSSYGDKKALIGAWLSARGGQEMNSFISHMINKELAFVMPKSTLCHDEKIDPSIRASAKTSDWVIDKDGRAVFNIDYQIKTIQFRDVSALLKGKDGIVREISTLSSEFESSNYNITYIASIACKIRLDLDNTGNVIPRVSSFVVVSYTDILKPLPNPHPTPDNQRKLEHRNSAPL